jgi:CheY-like chemotaxis protein
MPTRDARILCVENDPLLLRSRCSVLIHAGYSTRSASVWEADVLLRSGEQFDLVIRSRRALDSEIARVVSGAKGQRVWVLDAVYLPKALLVEVRLRLPLLQV